MRHRLAAAAAATASACTSDAPAAAAATTPAAPPLGGTSPSEADLCNVVALVAYEKPAESPLAWLLGPAQREHVADAANAAVLAAARGQPPQSVCVVSCGVHGFRPWHGRYQPMPRGWGWIPQGFNPCMRNYSHWLRLWLGRGQHCHCGLRPARHATQVALRFAVSLLLLQSGLERLLAQLASVRATQLETNHNQGEDFDLRQHLLPPVSNISLAGQQQQQQPMHH
eukprot:364362-Chlamydomonas_euryale.AAC.9